MRELLAIKVYKRWGMILGCTGRMKGRNLFSAVWCSNREKEERGERKNHTRACGLSLVKVTFPLGKI